MKPFRLFPITLGAVVALLLCFAPQGVAAQVVVQARLDTAAIRIGEQVQLTVTCDAPKKSTIVLPTFQRGDTLTRGVEVVAQTGIDSLVTASGQRQLTRRYFITSFDSALYAIPPFEVTVDGKRYKSLKSIGLKVSTVAVDTVHVDAVRSPHGVVMPAFEWRAALLLLALALWVVAVAFVVLVVRLSDRRPITRRVVIMPEQPAHVPATAGIESLKTADKQDAKGYYMQLTDTLRLYIERRFALNAREMTTAEIVDALTAEGNMAALQELQHVLRTADLVKFAKLQPELSEQDRSLMEALSFVQATKLEPLEPPKPRIEYVSVSAKREAMQRRFTTAGALLTALAGAALLAYVLGEVWQCFM